MECNEFWKFVGLIWLNLIFWIIGFLIGKFIRSVGNGDNQQRMVDEAGNRRVSQPSHITKKW